VSHSPVEGGTDRLSQNVWVNDCQLSLHNIPKPLDCLALEDGTGCPKTLGNNYQSTKHNIPGE